MGRNQCDNSCRFVKRLTILSLIVTTHNSRLKGDIYVLCNRYNLQTEVRYIWGGQDTDKFSLSALLPNAKKKMMECLRNQYLASKGKAKNEHIDQGDGVSVSDVITDCLGEYTNTTHTYQTVCIDESHFLKNLETYYGIAAGLLGLHSRRMMVLSGTPYCKSRYCICVFGIIH